MSEERDITITAIWRHETEDIAAVYYTENGLDAHVKDTLRAPTQAFGDALDRLVPHIAGPCYMLNEAHNGKVRMREVKIWYPSEGVLMAKLYAQLRPSPGEPDRFSMRSKKDEARGQLLRAVKAAIKHARAYVEGDRGSELLTDGIEKKGDDEDASGDDE